MLDFERLFANKAPAVKGDIPLEPGLYGAYLLREFVAVEGVAHLKAERVSGAEPYRLYAKTPASLHKRGPHRRRVRGGEVYLKAVLAGVSGPWDHRLGPGDLGHDEAEGADIVRRDVDEPGYDLCRRRPLQGYLGVLSAYILYKDIRPGDLLWNPFERLGDIRRVYAEKEPLVIVTVDDGVVDRAAVFVAQYGVLALAVDDPLYVVGGEPFDRFERARPRDFHLSHVADIEYADSRAHGEVLVYDAGILDRHLPARKINDAGAQRLMYFI